MEYAEIIKNGFYWKGRGREKRYKIIDFVSIGNGENENTFYKGVLYKDEDGGSLFCRSLISFRIEFVRATDTLCIKCIHNYVCDRDNKKRVCQNYSFGTSDVQGGSMYGCSTCLKRHKYFDGLVDCFECNYYKEA